jgi:hypothetical protein
MQSHVFILTLEFLIPAGPTVGFSAEIDKEVLCMQQQDFGPKEVVVAAARAAARGGGRAARRAPRPPYSPSAAYHIITSSRALPLRCCGTARHCHRHDGDADRPTSDFCSGIYAVVGGRHIVPLGICWCAAKWAGATSGLGLEF